MGSQLVTDGRGRSKGLRCGMLGERVVYLQSTRERRVGRKTKDVENPWVELLVSINDLLHNRSRPVSRKREISAAKMGRWCGKTWLKLPRGEAGRRLAAGGLLACLGPGHLLGTSSLLCTCRTKGRRGPPRDTLLKSFNFSSCDCVTVLQVRHTTLARILAGVSFRYMQSRVGRGTAPPGSRPAPFKSPAGAGESPHWAI